MAPRVQSSAGSSKKRSSKSQTKGAANDKAKPSFSLLKDGRPRKIVGLFLVLFSIFLAVSLISYLFTWQNDQDKVFQANGGIQFLFSDDTVVLNKGGRLGAWLSHQLIFNSFGMTAFLLVPLFCIWGLNLLLPHRLVSSLKTIFYSVFFILLLSPILAYIFPGKSFSFAAGGALGEKTIALLQELSGPVGTLCIITGLGMLAIIVLFNPVFHLPFWKNLALSPAPSGDHAPVAVSQAESRPEATIHGEHEAKLSIDDSYRDPEQQVVEHVVIDEMPVHLPDHFWEAPSVAEAVSTEIELEPTANETDTPKGKSKNPPPPDATPAEEVTLEVVQHEDGGSHIDDTKVSVGTDEPYDPSLELRNYKFPTLDLLDQHSTDEISIDKNELELHKNQIINTLKSFGIAIAKISATVGPTVTLYEIVPAEGVRISKIRNLEDDIALSLSALGIRIIAPIPGKGTIGIEVPNLRKHTVSMRTLIASDKFINNHYSLPIALGKKIDNENYIVDLATMPHLLMAGATGQGKSVGINAILVSLLYKKHPSQVKFVMVDPKKVELSIYKKIEKHFLAKLPNEEEAIITDTKKVINTLNALCIEMDNRYDMLKEAGVRNIKEYNEKFIKRKLNPNKGHAYLPFIILVVDEFADLIMTAGKEVEMPIARLAQLARAVGIHLIIATQRPSVNVITGTIKANFPGRIAFRVSAKVDSRTILDTGGADQLIGRGDMLILHGNDLVRVQCAFVDTPEVERIVDFIGSQQGYPTAFDLPEYEGADGGDLAGGGGGARSLRDVDPMFEQCARLVVSSGSGSTSMLQRRFNLGYNRAGRIMDQLEAAGIVGGSIGGKPRELLIHTEMELDDVLRGIGKG